MSGHIESTSRSATIKKTDAIVRYPDCHAVQYAWLLASLEKRALPKLEPLHYFCDSVKTAQRGKSLGLVGQRTRILYAVAGRAVFSPSKGKFFGHRKVHNLKTGVESSLHTPERHF